jgi:hypothetical protein
MAWLREYENIAHISLMDVQWVDEGPMIGDAGSLSAKSALLRPTKLTVRGTYIQNLFLHLEPHCLTNLVTTLASHLKWALNDALAHQGMSLQILTLYAVDQFPDGTSHFQIIIPWLTMR